MSQARYQRRFAALICVVGATACGGSETPPPASPVQERPALCSAPLPGTLGATPLKNDTSTQVDLAGSDDLLMAAMDRSGCFTLVEREQIAILIEEIRLCDDGPNKDFFDCSSFAKKGKLLGLKTLVTGSLTFFEPRVKGADLSVKLPGIGGVEAGREYAAMRITLRAVDFETAKIVTTAEATALVPSDQAGLELSGGGFGFRAAAFSKTPFGDALSGMIEDAVEKLYAGMRS